jgi:tRNA1Val (adenine37-N6)-methyltransferase
MGNEFRFKNFSIRQDHCAMKVGTDGVLLGAWAQGGNRILDIGTGTGLIALMMAQRYPKAIIDAIEIDSDACLQAKENVVMSPYQDRVQVIPSSLQLYKSEGTYDAIVCNPPFFLNSLKNPDNKRTIARHAETLSYADLFHHVKRLLNEGGVFSAIIPKESLESFLAESYISGLFIHRKCWISTIDGKPEKRLLLSFGKHRNAAIEETHVRLLNKDRNKSECYKKLTDDFYLDSIAR